MKNIFTKQWAKATVIREIKTVAQTATEQNDSEFEKF